MRVTLKFLFLRSFLKRPPEVSPLREKFSVLPSRFVCDDHTQPPLGNVYYAVFAGRR